MRGNRVGTVTVSKEMYEALPDNYWSPFFAIFFPFAITLDHNDDLIYHGHCKRFRKLKQGESVPEYGLVWDIDQVTHQVLKLKINELIKIQD